jgi:hypothetical protein
MSAVLIGFKKLSIFAVLQAKTHIYILKKYKFLSDMPLVMGVLPETAMDFHSFVLDAAVVGHSLL